MQNKTLVVRKLKSILENMEVFNNFYIYDNNISEATGWRFP